MTIILSLLILAPLLLAQSRPNPDAQKAAMRKLEFLTGKWSGEATVGVGRGKTIKVIQSEDAQYRLDGLILLIEGTGRDPESGKVVFNAVAIVSYDEAKGGYQIRAYSDGRQVESPLESDGAGFAWGFQSGAASIRHVMRVSEQGEWSGTSTVKVAESPEFTSVRMLLRRGR